MTTIQKWTLAAVIAGLLVLMGLLAWRAERERLQDQAELKVTLSTLGTQISQRNQQAAADVQAVDRQVQQAKTPDQQAALIAAIAGLKQAPTIVTVPAAPAPTSFLPPSSEGAKQEMKPLADAPQPVTAQPGDMVIPKADVPQLVSYTADCKKEGIDLASCQADLADTSKERDVAVKAAHGGSWFTRLKRDSKWLGIGLAIGGAAVAAAKH